ncbi:hypothetical protein SAMN02745121_01887 [Nannocystis exedens]|uniref:Uncharacterized protein n=1 Tax=Nannocystis exedens TaxID=54 RepID=A0A1I1VR40_9BACT|nr:hypothetical protein [Nannocystis exedens]PCC72770.1 hypothetical protein NAEX_05855 [Nannocystis exedens]SFD85517.1 hypothetical protein SAMN02745121_01887 [Nannocystis exedens]
MRCHAYLIRSERYLDIEEVLLHQLATASREQVLDLIGRDFRRVELLSGEWRLLFTQPRVHEAYRPTIGTPQRRVARMMAAPDQLAPLVNTLWQHEIRDRWRAITFGLQHLTCALPLASGLVGAVFVEEPDAWLSAEPTHEILAIHPDVFALIGTQIRKLAEEGDWPQMARLAADHCDSSVEFTSDKWIGLREQSAARAPALVRYMDGYLTPPELHESVVAAMRQMLDAHAQPSLDAWLRVHADRARYALVFRDMRRERSRASAPLLVATG